MSEFFQRSGAGIDTSSAARVDSEGAIFVKPLLSAGGNLTVNTNATGANFSALPAQACAQLTVCNDTGFDLEFRQGGTGATFTVFDGTYYTINGVSNANQIEFRRKDQSSSPVAVKARWEA